MKIHDSGDVLTISNIKELAAGNSDTVQVTMQVTTCDREAALHQEPTVLLLAGFATSLSFACSDAFDMKQCLAATP